MTKVNSFYDFKNKYSPFIKPTADITYTIHTLHIRTNRSRDMLNQLRKQFEAIIRVTLICRVFTDLAGNHLFSHISTALSSAEAAGKADFEEAVI